ncbi:uncharacterized protein LOC133173474 [Saccostrea echinata]|uniref:uncharacterized protein LOC133173474 n=1 Tax=Saccostrea echinata TaxID=191078 RepID=UPI002A823AD0|nr:uncharacterized protein LOC133173474 [Saccostrea echinata]
MARNSCKRLFIRQCVILSLFTIFLTVTGVGTYYRRLYAREVETLRNTGIFRDVIGVHSNVHSVSSCLLNCLRIQICLSFQYNKMEGHCRLYSNIISSSDVPQKGTRYFSAMKADCSEDAYIYEKALGLCWKPYSEKLNYTEAAHTCLNDRGQLLRISSYQIWLYLKEELAEHPMSLFWIRSTTNGTHLVTDDDTMADFLFVTEEAEEMDPNNRVIIARDQEFQGISVPPSSRNGFLCQVATRTES